MHACIRPPENEPRPRRDLVFGRIRCAHMSATTHAACGVWPPTRSTLFAAAVRGGTTQGVCDMTSLLLAGVSPDAADDEGFTALYVCCREGHSGCVRLLIEAGADIERGLYSPLYVSAFMGHVECLQLLLYASAAVDAPTEEGFTPLIIACQEGRAACVSHLLTAGADVDQTMEDGATGLFLSCQEGHARCIPPLVAAGADVACAMEDGFTPLSIACQEGHHECAHTHNARALIATRTCTRTRTCMHRRARCQHPHPRPPRPTAYVTLSPQLCAAAARGRSADQRDDV